MQIKFVAAILHVKYGAVCHQTVNYRYYSDMMVYRFGEGELWYYRGLRIRKLRTKIGGQK